MSAIVANQNPILLQVDMEKSLDKRAIADQVDMEKNLDKSASAHQHASQIFTSGVANRSNVDDSYDSDGKSWHDGVLRIRAITTMWSKKSMWTMFAL